MRRERELRRASIPHQERGRVPAWRSNVPNPAPVPLVSQHGGQRHGNVRDERFSVLGIRHSLGTVAWRGHRVRYVVNLLLLLLPRSATSRGEGEGGVAHLSSSLIISHHLSCLFVSIRYNKHLLTSPMYTRALHFRTHSVIVGWSYIGYQLGIQGRHGSSFPATLSSSCPSWHTLPTSRTTAGTPQCTKGI